MAKVRVVIHSDNGVDPPRTYQIDARSFELDLSYGYDVAATIRLTGVDGYSIRPRICEDHGHDKAYDVAASTGSIGRNRVPWKCSRCHAAGADWL